MSYYIYKICCDDLPDFVYVGSTKVFRQRKHQHKSNCNNINSKEYDKKLYQTIRENGGWDNWRMVLIEECGEISFIQAKIKEEEQRVKLNANLNMLRCHQTEEEKKEYHKEYKKEWYENNKEHHKEKNKEWRENNKEYNKEKSKEWRENNKEKIKEKRKEKYTCKCGREILLCVKTQHEKSKKHLEYIESLEKD